MLFHQGSATAQYATFAKFEEFQGDLDSRETTANHQDLFVRRFEIFLHTIPRNELITGYSTNLGGHNWNTYRSKRQYNTRELVHAFIIVVLIDDAASCCRCYFLMGVNLGQYYC